MCENFKGINAKCNTYEMKRKVELIYRNKKYGKWQPCSIVLPVYVDDINSYIQQDLKGMGIVAKEIQITKIIKM